MFDSKCDNITLIDPSGKHSLTVARDILLKIPHEWFITIKMGFNLGFSFPNNDNLFNMNQRILKVIDPCGKEQFIVREQFANMLEIIERCKQQEFNINLSQLFDTNKSAVELFDKQGKKAIINRNQIIHMLKLYLLLTNNGYNFKDYDNLFDEKEQYIVCYDKQNQKRILSRKQIYKIMDIQKLPNERDKELTESENNLLMAISHHITRKKLFEWLPYTAKKWIPSLAIINKIPADQSHEYFYNNNYARLKVLKDEYQAKDYEAMEGIVSLGYILGLFDSKESTSEKAMNYIIDYFIKKGITTNELHNTYGAINLKKGYNKNFADFFMKNYAIDSSFFIEPDTGINMIGELFERFDEILESRPEKRIKSANNKQIINATRCNCYNS